MSFIINWSHCWLQKVSLSCHQMINGPLLLLKFTFRMPIKVYIGFYSKFGLVNITISNYHAFRNIFNTILLHKWFTLTLEEIHWSTIIIIKQSVNVRHFKGEKMSKVLWSHINHCVIKYLGNHQNWFWVSYIGVVLIFSYTK